MAADRQTRHGSTAVEPPAAAPAPAGLRRILLKLSGEALMGEEDYGVDPKMLKRVAHRNPRGHEPRACRSRS